LNIENWNKGAEKIKGYTADEILGSNFEVFYTPEDRAAQLPSKLINEAATHSKVTHEGWRIRKDGSRFWANILLTAIHDERGNVIGFTKILRDRTATKLSEDQLQVYEDRHSKMILEITDYAIILLDLDGNIENWNKGAEKIKGYSPEEIIGKSFRIFYSAEDQASKLPESLIELATNEGRAQAEGWRVLKASETGPNGVVLYVFLFDPTVAGADYGLGRILAAAYPDQTKLQEVWKLYTDSLATGGSLLNLTPVKVSEPQEQTK